MHQSTYTVIFLLAIAWHWAFCSQLDNYKHNNLFQPTINSTKFNYISNKINQTGISSNQLVVRSNSYPFNYMKSTALSRQKRQFFGGGSCCMPFQMNPICCPVPLPLPIPQPIPIPLPLPVPMPIPQPIPVGTGCCSCCMPMCLPTCLPRCGLGGLGGLGMGFGGGFGFGGLGFGGGCGFRRKTKF